MEISPTLEKLGIGLLTAALFAEPVFGLGGIGTISLKAIRRTDVDLLLGIVLCSGTIVTCLRLVVNATRAQYGVRI